MFCPRCGTQSQDFAAYCRACGARLSGNSLPQQTETDRLMRQMARDVRFISRKGIPLKLLFVPFILMLAFGLITFVIEVIGVLSGHGAQR